MTDELATFLETRTDLDRVATAEELSIEWEALHEVDADLAADVLDEPLAVHDRLLEALAATDADELEPRAIDVHIRDVAAPANG